jgi:tRNA 2-thiocytidine biosynthesis protein TtcA
MLDATDDAMLGRLYAAAPQGLEFRKLRKRILRETRAAIETYGMVRPEAETPERWLVCLSGGKDSYTLLAALIELRWRGLLPVDLLACNLDQGQPGFPRTVLPEFLAALGIPHRIEYRDTYSVVTEKVPEGRTYCALCSRLRRGHLYRIAREEGCAAVVLGHHRDDVIETFLLNLFHGGRLAAMPPKLLNEEGDLLVLRPLAFVAEEDCARFARAMRFPIGGAAAGADQAHAGRLGAGKPRPARGDLQGADQCPGRSSRRPGRLRLPLTRARCAAGPGRTDGRRCGEAQTSSSFEGMTGKKTPPERSPNQRRPSTSWSSPISTRR